VRWDRAGRALMPASFVIWTGTSWSSFASASVDE
jgi:hypothetical protein